MGYCHAPHSTSHFGVYPIFRHTHVSTDYIGQKTNQVHIGIVVHVLARRNLPSSPASSGKQFRYCQTEALVCFQHRRVVLHASNGMSKKGVYRITLKISWLIIILPKNIAVTDSGQPAPLSELWASMNESAMRMNSALAFKSSWCHGRSALLQMKLSGQSDITMYIINVYIYI